MYEGRWIKNNLYIIIYLRVEGSGGMKYGQFLAALRRNGAKHVYLLAGEETYYIRKAEQAVLKALVPEEAARSECVQSFDGDVSADELTGLIDTVPFFAEKTVLLVRNSNLFREKKGDKDGDKEEKKAKSRKKGDPMERLMDRLSNMPDTSYVIFETSAKADKRRKIYKLVESVGAVLEAERERPWTIDEWLRGKLSELNRELDREAMAYFMNAVSMMQSIELEFLDEELNKLALSTENRRFTKKDISRVFASVPEVSGFAMLDAVSARDMKKAIVILERQLSEGTYLPLILAGLSRHVRQLWQAKELMARGVRGRALGQPLNLNPVIAEKIGRAAQTFDAKLLRRVFLFLCDADYKLKTGQGGEELLEEAVIALCRK